MLPAEQFYSLADNGTSLSPPDSATLEICDRTRHYDAPVTVEISDLASKGSQTLVGHPKFDERSAPAVKIPLVPTGENAAVRKRICVFFFTCVRCCYCVTSLVPLFLRRRSSYENPLINQSARYA
jgi:hypothetical protein